MNKHYELVIVGAGPGGYIAAEHAGKNQLKTLVIENNMYGGVCLQQGCIPTKTMLRSAHVYHEVLQASKYGIQGINANQISLDWNQIIARKNQVVKQLTMGVKSILKNAHVSTINGYATLVDANTLTVNGETITFDKLIIATGSSPRKLNLPGFAQAYADQQVITSDIALNLSAVPNNFVVVGGGVIGVEFALLYAQLGAKVTILQAVECILEVCDSDVSAEITRILTDLGVTIIHNIAVNSVTNNTITYSVANEKHTLAYDKCLVSIGRTANTSWTNAVSLDKHPNGSLITNEHMQTNYPNIYAIGDCTSKTMLAHVAYKTAIVAVNHILQIPTALDYHKVPSCIYTQPESASIGYTEKDLIKNNIAFVKSKYLFAHIGKVLCDGQSQYGFLKLLAAPDSGKILGCHIVGENASDLISEIALAMESEASILTLFNTIHPHPTVSEVIWEAVKKMLHEHFADHRLVA